MTTFNAGGRAKVFSKIRVNFILFSITEYEDGPIEFFLVKPRDLSPTERLAFFLKEWLPIHERYKSGEPNPDEFLEHYEPFMFTNHSCFPGYLWKSMTLPPFASGRLD